MNVLSQTALRSIAAIILACVCVHALLFIPRSTEAAGVPSILSYQGRLTDASGNLLGGSGTTYYFKFSIWTTSVINTGTRLWPASAPTSVTSTVRQGVFTVNIGDTANGYPDTLNYAFDSDTVYLQVEVSSNGSSFETLSPRHQISSAAFAQVAGATRGAGQSAIGTTTPHSSSVLTVDATTSSATALTLRAFSGQSANILSVFDSVGSSLLSINGSGSLVLGSLTGPLHAQNGVVSATTSISAIYGGTGQTTYSIGDILYASAAGTLTKLPIGSTDGQVLKVSGGVPSWGADLLGSGGASAWATSTNNLFVYPGDTSDVILIGASATSTTGNIFEVAGSSLFRGSLVSYFNLTAPRFTATSTTASVFPYASTTGITVSGTADFGNLLLTGSTTLQNFTFGNATGSAATTSKFAITGITGSLLATNANGSVVATTSIGANLINDTVSAFIHASTTIPKTYTANTFTALQTFGYASTTGITASYASSTLYYGAGLANCNTGNMLTWTDGRFGCEDDTAGGGSVSDFTFESNYGVLTAASTSAIWAKTGIFASSTSHFVSADFTNATTSNLHITGLTGALLATDSNGRVFSTTTIGANLLDTSGNWSGTFDSQEGSFYLANSFSTTSANHWSSLGLGFSTTSAIYFADASTTIAKTYSSNTFIGSNMFLASTTIGASGQTTGLTISGGATTTGNAYIAGNLGIGTTSPYTKLSVVGEVAARNFTATSTSATSTLPTLSVQSAANLFGTYANSLDDLCTAITGGSGLCDGVDSTGSGGNGLATSTDIADTWIIYGTSINDVGAESAFTYDDATNKLIVTYASTTGITASYASSTLWYGGGLASDCNSTSFLQWTAGQFGCGTPSGGGSYPFALAGNATSSLTQFNGGITAFASSTIGNGTQAGGLTIFGGATTTGNLVVLGNATTTNLAATGLASTSHLVASNSFTFSNVTGFLKATAGAVATAAIDLATDVTGILTTARGGTGWGAIQANTLVLGNGTNAIATTSAGTNGQVLGLVSGVPTWVATTTLSTISGTLGVAQGGTGATTFSYGLIGSTGGTSALTNFATSSLGLLTTNVAEGSNQYYTDTRVQSFVHSSTTIPKTYTANTFTALQTFGYASTTGFTASYASSTLYYGAGLANCNTENMLTWTDGRFGCESDTSGAGGAFEWTPTTYAGVNVNSTSTPLWLKGTSPFSLIASSTFATYASSTQLTAANALWLGSIRWDDGNSKIDGEQIGDDTIDDDSIDLADITLADFTNDADYVKWASATSSAWQSANLLVTGSTTLQNFTAANATTTSLAITNLSSSLLYANSSGSVVATTTLGINLLETSLNGFIHASTTVPKTYTANTFSALQTFGYASTTGITASYASSTLYYGAGLADCNTGNMLTWTSGRFGCEDDSQGAGGSDFTFESNYGVLTAASTSALWAKSGLFASSTSHFVNADFTNATTSNLHITGLTGALLATDANGRVFATTTIGANLIIDTVNTFIHASTTIPKTYTANTFTALQTFGYASTTGITASYASSTLYFGAGLSNCNSENMLTWTDGRFGCEADTSGAGGGWPFTPGTNYGVAVESTTTPAWYTAGVFASSTSHFVNFDFTAATSTGLSYFSGGIISSASSTFSAGLFATQATTTYLSVGSTASTTALVVSNLASGSILKATTGGAIIAASADSDFLNNASSIETLGDVSAMTENYGDLLGWNGSSWVDFATSSLDIDATGLANADFGEFTCNGTTCTLDAESQTLAEASDVTVTAAAYGDILMYNGSAWVDTATSTLFSNSGGLGLWLSDETGSGSVVFGTSPSITTPTINTSLTVTDDDWLGLGSAAANIEFDDLTRDEVNILNANVGIGTTTPYALLTLHAFAGQTNLSLFTIASSTASATTTLFSVSNTGLTTIGDSSGTGDAIFQFASDTNAWAAGYYSTDKTFRIASSTNLTSNVYFQIGKSGTTTLSSGITSSNVGQYLCIDATTFQVLRNNSACAPSSIRFKENIMDMEYGLDTILQLRPITFTFKESMNFGTTTQLGFIAEEVEGVIPEIVAYGNDGLPSGLNYPLFTAVLTKAFQEMHMNMATIASTTASSTPASQSFAASFMNNIFTRLTQWFADAANGIGEFIATRIRAKEEICVDDQCLTRDDIRALIDLARNSQAAAAGGSDSPVPEPEPEPTATTTPPVEDGHASSTPPVAEEQPSEPAAETPVEESAAAPEEEPEPEAVPAPEPEQEPEPVAADAPPATP